MKDGFIEDRSAIGRFDKSFLIQMIRDFFVILVLVAALEFSLKAGLVYWSYETDGEAEAATAAQEIAENVRSIMINEGGPVAARALYPIIEKNWADLGYVIAVEPSPVTIASIEETFDFTPKGVPAAFPEGRHKAASVELVAAQTCLGCHVTASVGDVLGVVTVRNYLSKDFAAWWREIGLTAGLAIGKIVFHSILLFILLRARLEPLMRLRSVVGDLAKAYGGLDRRAEVRSTDEFGVLARDLNLFLDRIAKLVGELDAVLRKVVSVNDDIISIQSELREKVDAFSANARRIERRAMMSAKREPLLSNAWFEAVSGSIDDLDQALAAAEEAPGAAKIVATLRGVVDNAEAQIRSSEALFADLAELGEDADGFRAAVAEMARLEERMKGVIETGTLLVRRLKPADASV
ncbi:MAG: histidine kinase [Pseudomonadota bacterium]